MTSGKAAHKRQYLTKKNSTRAERVFAQALNDLRLPFEHRAIVKGMEVDFLVGQYAIEIDGHTQNAEKNLMLKRVGYIPVHLSNAQLKEINAIKIWLQTLQMQQEQS